MPASTIEPFAVFRTVLSLASGTTGSQPTKRISFLKPVTADSCLFFSFLAVMWESMISSEHSVGGSAVVSLSVPPIAAALWSVLVFRAFRVAFLTVRRQLLTEMVLIPPSTFSTPGPVIIVFFISDRTGLTKG